MLHQVAYLAALKYAVHTRRLDGIHPFRKIRGCTKRTLVSVPLTAEEVRGSVAYVIALFLSAGRRN